jgi:hypothetical protein
VRARRWLVAGVVAVLVGAPAAGAFFFTTVEQPQTLSAATPSTFVDVAVHGPDTAAAVRAAVVGGPVQPAGRTLGVLTLTAAAALPGAGPVHVVAETADGFSLVLAGAKGDASGKGFDIAPGEHATLRVVGARGGAASGETPVTLRYTFADGSVMRDTVTVRWPA